MKPTLHTLKNGLRVVLAQHRTSPVISYQAWVGVGSTNETAAEAGLSHVLEHMLFKGTQKRGTGQIARDVENAGGYINAWTSHDETVFHVTLASRYKDQGLNIIADAIQNAAIDAGELERELEVIREEIRMGKDSPGRIVVEEMFKNVFHSHPYAKPVIGYDRTVKKFDRKMVHDFYRRWYAPSNVVFVVCGDFDREKMLRQVEQHFSTFKSQGIPSTRRRGTAKSGLNTGLRVTSQIQPFAEANFALGFRTTGVSHADTPALDLLATILGQGSSSRLELKLNRELGLVNDIRAMSYTPSKGGIFGVFASTTLDRIETAIEKTIDAVYGISKERIRDEDLDKARTLLESDSVYSEETVDGIARKLGYYELHLGDLQYEQHYLQALSACDPESLKEVSSRYLNLKNTFVSTVLPDPDQHPPTSRRNWFSKKGIDTAAFEKRLVTNTTKSWQKIHKKTKMGPVKTGFDTQIVRLSSGDTLIIKPEPGSRYAAARAAFMGGGLREPGTKAGLVSLLGNAWTRGTGSHTAEEIAVRSDVLACAIHGFSGRNSHGIQGEFLARNFASSFKLMTECLRDPIFPEAELKRELALQAEELKSTLDDPSSRAFSLLRKALYKKHPYGRMLIGTQESIGTITRKDVVDFHRKYTKPGSMVLAVVGGVHPEEVIELSESFLEHGPATPQKPRALPQVSFSDKGPRQFLETLPREQSHVVIGFPGTSIDAEDRYALEVAMEILGGHGGRLFANVRDKHGLAYHISAGAWEGVLPGMVTVYSATSPGNENQLVDVILDELSLLKKAGAQKTEFDRIKRHMLGSRVIAKQRASARAAAMALGELYGIGCDIFEQDERNILAVGREDVINAAEKFLNKNKMVVTCVGPRDDELQLI